MGKKFCNVEKKWCKFCQKDCCKIAKDRINNVLKCPRIAEIETITLYSLIREVNFDDVFKRICFYYNDQEENKEGYKNAFNELLLKRQRKHNLNDLFINVEIVNENGNNYLNTDGINIKNGRKYGIEFCSWSYWVTMFITNETLNSLSKEDIVAGCLYEMTFFGYSEKRVVEEKKEIDNSIEKAKKDYEKEKKN